ncbi:MAG: response regulator [Bdellovibrio sp.]|nr:response regulator [Bdellovibrio sp.]
MKKILLVEDDPYFRAAIKNILSKKYDVIEADNGKVARDLIPTIQPDLILTDIQMPHLSGVELLEWLKVHRPTPVILMTGFSHILETQEAHSLGADEFLAKPFKEEELIEKIRKIFREDETIPAAPAAPIDLDKEFCRLPLEDFVNEKEADYPIYIRMSGAKYIKIAHQGGKLSPDKIALFKEKGVTHLYIRQEDFSKLVGFTLLISKAVSSSGQVEREKKMRFMTYTGEMLVQQAFVQGTDEALFRNAKDFLTTSLDILTEDQQTFSLLNILSSHSDVLYAHSLGVSVFSVLIAKQLGWQSPQTLFKLSFAGLFHDIGKKELRKELLEKPRALMTQEERTLMESHPTRGKEILESLRTAPSEVIQVAYEHHEDILGQGYPRGIDSKRIHPMTSIVTVADAFCNYTLKNPNNPVALFAPEAFLMIRKFKESSLDGEAVAALSKVINHGKVA